MDLRNETNDIRMLIFCLYWSRTCNILSLNRDDMKHLKENTYYHYPITNEYSEHFYYVDNGEVFAYYQFVLKGIWKLEKNYTDYIDRTHEVTPLYSLWVNIKVPIFDLGEEK